MFRVAWVQNALDDLAVVWLQADAGLRQAITAAAAQLDQQLQSDPWGPSESRPGGRHIIFVPPLGAFFRLEADGQTISVLRVWVFQQHTP
jgi:hypothetical protein